MEFKEKLQELRKKKGLTQEELADQLFVSRTAVSKWESGRGYPNIDSLKSISKMFSVTIDELLSGDQLLTIAEEENKKRQKTLQDLVFGLLDISVVIFLFLPFFGQKTNGVIQEVSLLYLTNIAAYLKTGYFLIVFGVVLFGILTLALQSVCGTFWLKIKNKISLILNILAIILFIISLQPYAAIFMFVFLVIKVLILVKSNDT